MSVNAIIKRCTTKLSSGRFLLTVISGISLLMIVGTVCHILRVGFDKGDISADYMLGVVNSCLLVLSNVFTFYFTKKSDNPEPKEEINKES